MAAEPQKRLNRALRQALARGLQGNYAACWGVHPACAGCGKLHPEMVFTIAELGLWPSDFSTKCCGTERRDWRFVVGTRKGCADGHRIQEAPDQSLSILDG